MITAIKLEWPKVEFSNIGDKGSEKHPGWERESLHCSLPFLIHIFNLSESIFSLLVGLVLSHIFSFKGLSEVLFQAFEVLTPECPCNFNLKIILSVRTRPQ